MLQIFTLLCSCDWCFTNLFHHTQGAKCRVFAETTFVCTNQRCRAPMIFVEQYTHAQTRRCSAPIIFVESTFVFTKPKVQRTGNNCRLTSMERTLEVQSTDNLCRIDSHMQKPKVRSTRNINLSKNK